MLIENNERLSRITLVTFILPKMLIYKNWISDAKCYDCASCL